MIRELRKKKDLFSLSAKDIAAVVSGTRYLHVPNLSMFEEITKVESYHLRGCFVESCDLTMYHSYCSSRPFHVAGVGEPLLVAWVLRRIFLLACITLLLQFGAV